MRVGVLGAGGRVGSEVCRAVLGEQDLELVAAVDPKLSGIDVSQVLGFDAGGLHFVGDISACSRVPVDVFVDFTSAEPAVANLEWALSHGIASVIGATGFSQAQQSRMRDLVARTGGRCLWAANFSVGAVVLMKLAALAAPYFDTAEVVEMHHNHKLDAPSGTARVIVERIEKARASDFAADPTESTHETRGERSQKGIGIHSLRVEGAVAHHEVIFGLQGQTLTLRHDSYDRSSFIPGVLLAIRHIAEIEGLVIGLDALLEEL